MWAPTQKANSTVNIFNNNNSLWVVVSQFNYSKSIRGLGMKLGTNNLGSKLEDLGVYFDAPYGVDTLQWSFSEETLVYARELRVSRQERRIGVTSEDGAAGGERKATA